MSDAAGGHPALQPLDDTSPTVAAVALASQLMAGKISPGEGVASIAAHVLTFQRAEVLVATLTQFTPEDTDQWTSLGGRAWIREWNRPGSTATVTPAGGAGGEAALTMPWLSPAARAGVVVLMDTELLPPEADQDRVELDDVGVRALIGSSLTIDGGMYGSMSVASFSPGSWPGELVQDFRLLTSALSARIAVEHSRRAMAEAIASAAQAQTAYQQFLASVGHELRTPLAAIAGYTEMLVDDAQEAPDDPVSAAMLKDGPVILRACDKLISVVDNLLGAGRSFASDGARQDVCVAEAVADVVHWHRTPAASAQVEICCDIDPTVTVWSNSGAVRQALTYLVSNAVAHHRPGGRVDISTAPLQGESGRPMVRIVVRDDGPGLTQAQLDHVFEPFVRFARPEVKGSGLGLPLARTLAERDGGSVRAESTPGSGSAFWLELPARPPIDPS